MPKDEHVAVLSRGATVWNAWRTEHDEVPDLSRAALRGLDLTGVRSLPSGSSRCRPQGNETLWCGFVGCPSGGSELFQSGTRWRRSRQGLSGWSSISELCP